MGFFLNLFKEKVRINGLEDAIDHLRYAANIDVLDVSERLSDIYLKYIVSYLKAGKESIVLGNIIRNQKICKTQAEIIRVANDFIPEKNKEEAYAQVVEDIKTLGLLQNPKLKEFLNSLSITLNIDKKSIPKIHKNAREHLYFSRLVSGERQL